MTGKWNVFTRSAHHTGVCRWRMYSNLVIAAKLLFLYWVMRTWRTQAMCGHVGVLYLTPQEQDSWTRCCQRPGNGAALGDCVPPQCPGRQSQSGWKPWTPLQGFLQHICLIYYLFFCFPFSSHPLSRALSIYSSLSPAILGNFREMRWIGFYAMTTLGLFCEEKNIPLLKWIVNCTTIPLHTLLLCTLTVKLDSLLQADWRLL